MSTIAHIASYWLRFFCSYNVSQPPKLPVQITKISKRKKQLPFMTLDIIPLIIDYARMTIVCYGAVDDPWPFTDMKPDDIISGWEGIIIDLGSGSIKAGWCNEDAPTKIFPPVVAYDKDKKIIIGNDIDKHEKENKTVTNKHYVVEKGTIINFDEIMEILKYIIKDIDDELLAEMGIMIVMSTESESIGYYRKLAELMYAQLNIWGLQFLTTSYLGLCVFGGSYTGLFILIQFNFISVVFMEIYLSCFHGAYRNSH